jgi:ABC-type phosphate/phosphonate transport system substrate-binding protein
MLASLPMYDLPEVRASTDALWIALAQAYGVSGELTRGANLIPHWRSPDMLFSQTCGYPFTHELAGQLTYVATPNYKADGCEGPLYRSIIFARQSEQLHAFQGRIAAYNSRDSMSGFLALKLAFAKCHQDSSPTDFKGKPFFSATVESGSHVASLAMVQSGKADVCAIDCVTVGLLRKHRPSALAGLYEIGRSPLVPGLPYVTLAGDAKLWVAALATVFRNTALEQVRGELLLADTSVLQLGDYDIIPRYEAQIADTLIVAPV